MMNFFSIFDPTTSLSYSLNWFSIFLILMLSPYQFWLIPSRFLMMWNLMINFIFKEFKSLILYSFSNMLLILTLFIYIFWVNALSLFPYIFSPSSHLIFSFSLSLSLWLSIFFYFIFNYQFKFFIHLTPLGTPFFLILIMNIIELISMSIRPITLSIRLSANIIAGHLLISLLSSFNNNLYNNIIIFLFFIFLQILLFMLEIFVSFIQAYVFSILTLLYMKEI